ncbi:MAG: serine hydrolase domain-containing protein [Roseiflexaceae bacterium]
MKIRPKTLVFAGIVVVVMASLYGLWYLNVRPLTRAEALTQIHTALTASQSNNASSSGMQVRIVSTRFGIDDAFATGTYEHDGAQGLVPNQPFHAASIGKLFTSVTIMQLAEEGALDIADPVADYLAADVLAGLFVHGGVDYAGEVTIGQLMEHTSGVADYFADPVDSGLTVQQDITQNVDTLWTPEMLLAVSRQRQHAVGTPGKQFHYSDTGYVLLGLIIEKVEQKPFHQVLADRFFVPLAMVDSYMPYRSTPTNPQPLPMADAWVDGVNVRATRSISADWAGGGVVTTPNDLLRFSQALHNYSLISKASYLRMITMRNQFRTGLYYGVGMMAVRFGEFSWTLDFLPESLGHIGILATHLWYEPMTETTVVLNYGSTDRLESSFMDLITIKTTLRRIVTAQP